MKLRLALGLFAAGTTLALGIGYFAYQALEPAQPGGDETTQLFLIERGQGLAQVARNLERAGLIKHARALSLLGRFSGDAGNLRTGEYEVSAGWSARTILDRITSGRVKTYEIVLPEGIRATEIAARLEAAGLANRRLRPLPRHRAGEPRGLSLPRDLPPGAAPQLTRDRARICRAVRAGLARDRFHCRESIALPARNRDPRIDHREGNRSAGRAAVDRSGVSQSTEEAHAARDRPDGDLWHRSVRRQSHASASARPLESIQHLSNCRPAPRSDRQPRDRRIASRPRTRRGRLLLLCFTQ
ncbi:MAG: endolytic transglycosylase MltG [Deltaproteobacteria bacterium]|nr:endolytic transglycosylase MltG [Deltaproteobacteria bacterium]